VTCPGFLVLYRWAGTVIPSAFQARRRNSDRGGRKAAAAVWSNRRRSKGYTRGESSQGRGRGGFSFRPRVRVGRGARSGSAGGGLDRSPLPTLGGPGRPRSRDPVHCRLRTAGPDDRPGRGGIIITRWICDQSGRSGPAIQRTAFVFLPVREKRKGKSTVGHHGSCAICAPLVVDSVLSSMGLAQPQAGAVLHTPGPVRTGRSCPMASVSGWLSSRFRFRNKSAGVPFRGAGGAALFPAREGVPSHRDDMGVVWLFRGVLLGRKKG